MDEDTLRLLQEKAHRLRELTRHPGWETLVEEIGVRLEAKRRALVAGSAKDYGDYRSLAAWIEGAEAVLALPEAMAERAKGS